MVSIAGELDQREPAIDPSGLPGEGEWAVAPFRALRRARLARGWECEDVARRLSLRPAYVHAIEDGRIADLPGPGAARSMLARYAALTGLDADEIVAACYVTSYFAQPTFSGSQRMNRRRAVANRRFVPWRAVSLDSSQLDSSSPQSGRPRLLPLGRLPAHDTRMMTLGVVLVSLGMALLGLGAIS